MVYIEPEGFQSNCYILDRGDFAFVIDPGVEAEKIIDILDEKGIKKISVILTHSHVDHWAGAPDLIKKTGCKIYMGVPAKEVCFRPEVNLSAMEGLEFPDISGWLDEGEVVADTGKKLRIIFTPGHTSGGISIETEDGVFTGDTVFAGGLGRTDLPTGNYETLMRSIREKLLVFPPETKLFPGHGPCTTVRTEKKFHV
ncbi:MAG: MBL fold metallo-hydrolase [Elusimicrobiota bacterium]|nr:MBL fold metallo-hydrolase [Elusimicrobiota bacterium]